MSADGYLKNLSPLGKMLKYKGQSFIHNPAMLNLQSLIMASLVLVVNRSVIANYSAIKAKGTPDGPYRTHEAYRTTIREFLGFTGGFIVLRQIQGWIKKGFKKALEIDDPENPNTYALWKNFKSWCSNPTKAIDEFKPKFAPDLTVKVNITKNPKAQKFIALTEKYLPGVKFTQDASKEAYIRQVYKLGPIVLASIPTVALAGVMLEKFTRDHADHVADFIGRHFGGDDKNKKAQPTIPAASTPFSAMSVAAPPVLPSFGASPQLPFQNMGNRIATTTPWATPRTAPMPARQPMANYPLV